MKKATRLAEQSTRTNARTRPTRATRKTKQGNKHATEFLPYGSAYLDEGTLEGLPVGVAKE